MNIFKRAVAWTKTQLGISTTEAKALVRATPQGMSKVVVSNTFFETRNPSFTKKGPGRYHAGK